MLKKLKNGLRGERDTKRTTFSNTITLLHNEINICITFLVNFSIIAYYHLKYVSPSCINNHEDNLNDNKLLPWKKYREQKRYAKL